MTSPSVLLNAVFDSMRSYNLMVGTPPGGVSLLGCFQITHRGDQTLKKYLDLQIGQFSCPLF